MATRILVKPIVDYYVAFLATRGIDICTDKPDVICYFNDSKRKLRKLVAKHNPDLVIICNKKAFDLNHDFPFAFDAISKSNDIHVSRTVQTNAMDLAKLYYRSLGLERLLVDCSEYRRKKQKEKREIKSSTVKKIFSVLMWD